MDLPRLLRSSQFLVPVALQTSSGHSINALVLECSWLPAPPRLLWGTKIGGGEKLSRSQERASLLGALLCLDVIDDTLAVGLHPVHALAVVLNPCRQAVQ